MCVCVISTRFIFFFFKKKITIIIIYYLKAQVDSAFRAAFDKTVALGQRMDIVFYQIRIGV